ncbi:hypothetical protein MmiHf6_03890 [Methanimicrococcus hongohii]|uniref:Uncharacterized protein n=1 Tax=Methanimicrococcus hongohii TaxID=3028295 RepID=A0AA96ZS65_9EURY|nr:hypothetical protein MmiHf6_03890 [Methanimicrococcus sp. Hf6]
MQREGGVCLQILLASDLRSASHKISSGRGRAVLVKNCFAIFQASPVCSFGQVLFAAGGRCLFAVGGRCLFAAGGRFLFAAEGRCLLKNRFAIFRRRCFAASVSCPLPPAARAAPILINREKTNIRFFKKSKKPTLVFKTKMKKLPFVFQNKNENSRHSFFKKINKNGFHVLFQFREKFDSIIFLANDLNQLFGAFQFFLFERFHIRIFKVKTDDRHSCRAEFVG